MIRYNSIQDYETYNGIYKTENNGTIYGFFTYGALEPQYAGLFSITKLMKQFNPITENFIYKPKYNFLTSYLEGKWVLSFHSNLFVSSYEIILYSNLTWQSINNENCIIAGKWNIFENNIDITSGIHGSGSKLWLWMQRFGKMKSITRGVQLDQDRLYIGNIQPSPQKNISENLNVRNVKGYVQIGWEVDPEFIGKFIMKRSFS
jgi:hypothetical protein